MEKSCSGQEGVYMRKKNLKSSYLGKICVINTIRSSSDYQRKNNTGFRGSNEYTNNCNNETTRRGFANNCTTMTTHGGLSSNSDTLKQPGKGYQILL